MPTISRTAPVWFALTVSAALSLVLTCGLGCKGGDDSNPSPRPNTHVYVLDSVGGAYVENSRITLKDADGNLLEDNISLPQDKNGSLILDLDPEQKYNIYAKGAGSAEACFARFDPSRENTATLYCRPHNLAGFPAEAPIITDISFGNQASPPDSSWLKLPDNVNYLSRPLADLQYVKITAISKCGIAELLDYPPPININIDALAWLNAGVTGAALEDSISVNINGNHYYQSTYVFKTPVLNNISTADHWLDIVVYDLASNRTEQRVYLNILDSAATETNDDDLSALTPALYAIQAETYGISMDLPAINPIDSYGASYSTLLAFNLSYVLYEDYYDYYDSGYPAIRGFEVWRSDGNQNNFKLVDAVYYAAPNDGAFVVSQSPYLIAQEFLHSDRGPDVAEDFMYYKIRVFNGNPANGGFSRDSNILCVKPLPPFTTRLAEPFHGAVAKKAWPCFKFKVTNPALLGADTSDQFYFSLYIKNVGFNEAVFDAAFVALITETDETGQPRFGFWNNYSGEWQPALCYDEGGIVVPFVWLEDDGIIAIDTNNYVFQTFIAYHPLLQGVSYSWNIFGMYGGVVGSGTFSEEATNSAFFYKEYPAPNGAAANAFSFGSIYDYGLGATNGFYTITIDPDAK